MAFAADYVDVAQRIREFRDKHPEGSLRPADIDRPYWVENIEGVGLRLVYVAAAYRYPEDPTPGIGMAWEPLPGRTPYTKDSELMVAETSAWGRAIVAALAGDTKKSVASADEVKARQPHDEPAGIPAEDMAELLSNFHNANDQDALTAAINAVRPVAKQLFPAQNTVLVSARAAATKRVEEASAE